MRSALRILLVTAVLAPAAADLPSQQSGFEGTVTFQTDRGTEMFYSVSGGKVRVDMVGGRGSRTMIIDPAKKTMTMLLVAQKMYMLRPLPPPPMADSSQPDATLTNTGKTEVIAGEKCEVWHAQSPRGSFDVCASRSMGAYLPAAGMGMRRGAPPAPWAKMVHGSFFPLRVTNDSAGQVVLLATKVERKQLDASFFEVPAGYSEMTMPGGMGGPGGPPMGPPGTPPER